MTKLIFILELSTLWHKHKSSAVTIRKKVGIEFYIGIYFSTTQIKPNYFIVLVAAVAIKKINPNLKQKDLANFSIRSYKCNQIKTFE